MDNRGIVPPFDRLDDAAAFLPGAADPERVAELGFVPGALSQQHNVDHDEGYGQPRAERQDEPPPPPSDQAQYAAGVRAGMESRARLREGGGTYTRSRAKAAQEKRERGYVFWLFDTDDGVPAPVRVRKIPLAKFASIQGLSPRQQNVIMEVLEDAQEGRLGVAKTWTELAKTQDKQEEVANAICIGAFIAPRLVLTEQEEMLAGDDDDVMWVERISITDRVRFFNTLMAPEGSAARQLEPFPEAGVAGSPAAPSVPSAEAAL